MPTTVVERYGSLSATGIAKETTFGTAVAATTFLPMTGNNLELDPGLFSPKVMFAQRDVNAFALYGQYKVAGSLTAPLFPTNGTTLLAGAIGTDAAAQNGVTGTGSTSPTTVSSGGAAGTNTVTVASAAGYSIGSIIQIDVNAAGPPVTTAEVRKVTNVAGAVLTVDQNFGYSHASGAAVKIVSAPYAHTITQANTLPSYTVEKNLGNFESLQFKGCRVNKFDLSQQATNTEASLSIDLIAQNAAVLATPTAVSVTNENPYVYAEATATIFSTNVTQTTAVDLTIENGLKDTFTLNQAHTLQFLTPTTLHASGKVDLVFTSLDDATWGYWTQMVNGTGGALAFSLAHPSSGGTITINLPVAKIRTSTDAVKMEDVVITSLTFEAFLSFTSLTTVNATIVSPSVYLPY